ncbi:MAG: arsenite efflux MFS transporter ArsK [Alsobacter sp.]
MQPRSATLSPTVLVALLGVSQIVGYGTLYYSFGILAAGMARDLGWSVPSVFAAFSASLLLGGLFAQRAGRLIDRFGAASVMTVGSCLAALALVVLARSQGPVGFLVGLALVQVSSTLALYDAAFACIVQRVGTFAARRITHLTLIAGFASTLFWPLTTQLATVMDWRQVLVLYAVLDILVAAPIHLVVALSRPRQEDAPLPAPHSGPVAAEGDTLLPDSVQTRAMVLVASGFALGGFVLSAVLSQMVPLLGALGLGGSAVLVSTLFGPSQVLIRLASLAPGRVSHPVPGALVSGAMMPLSLALLALPGPALLGASLFAVALGCGSGLKSIVQGTLPLALFGRNAYAERLGRIAAVRFVVTAAAPFVLAWLLEAIGPGPALAVLAAAGIGGLACLWEVARLQRGPRGAPSPDRRPATDRETGR